MEDVSHEMVTEAECPHTKDGIMTEEAMEAAQIYLRLFENNLDPKKYFSRKKYKPYFEKYCAEQENNFSEIKKSYEAAEEKELFLQNIAQTVADYALKDVSSCKGFKKESRKGEFNLFLVTSVFPCTLHFGEEFGDKLCEKISQEWEKTFLKTKLGYSSFEKINESFRSPLGFLTGR